MYVKKRRLSRRTSDSKRSNGGHHRKRRRDGGKAEMGSGRWESLNADLLLDIFGRLEPWFSLTTIAWACRSWGRVIYHQSFSKDGEHTLNFTALDCEFCNRFLLQDPLSNSMNSILMKLLRGVMDVYVCDEEDGGIRVTSITKMAFPSWILQLTDDHVVYAAEWSPELRELYLPCGRAIKHKGFSRAIRHWNGIEMMSIGSLVNNDDVYRIIGAIGINCKKLEVLRLFGFFLNQQLSPKIVQILKGLKILILQNVHIAKVGLKNLLSKCKKLQKWRSGIVLP